MRSIAKGDGLDFPTAQDCDLTACFIPPSPSARNSPVARVASPSRAFAPRVGET
jgi:hypothetical protein